MAYVGDDARDGAKYNNKKGKIFIKKGTLTESGE